jgi:hypothetical protein
MTREELHAAVAKAEAELVARGFILNPKSIGEMNHNRLLHGCGPCSEIEVQLSDGRKWSLEDEIRWKRFDQTWGEPDPQ